MKRRFNGLSCSTCGLHVLVVKRLGGGLLGYHNRLLKYICQTFAELFIQFIPAPASALSSLWIIMSMLFGMFFALPSIEIQVLFGFIAFSVSGYFAVDTDVESFAVMLLFFWLIKDTYIICQHLFSHLLDDLKPKRMAHL